jgi:hypothetical protein
MNIHRPFITLEGEPDVDLPLERPLFDPPEQIAAVDRPSAASMLIDEDALVALYETFFIDEAILQDNIKRLLMSRSELTLAELVASYPITQGMAELMAYVLIAAQEPQHNIDRRLQDRITIQMLNGDEREVIVPRVIFRRVVNQPEANHA